MQEPREGSLSAPTPTQRKGLASGREAAEIPVLSFPLSWEIAASTAPVFPKPMSGLGPDSTGWHGVGSCPAGSPTCPSPQLPRGLPGVHEALLSCLPRLAGAWKAELVLRRPDLPASALPHLCPGARPRGPAPWGKPSGRPGGGGPRLGAAQLPPHPSAADRVNSRFPGSHGSPPGP